MDFAEVFTQKFLLTWEGRFNRARYWAFFLVSVGIGILAGVLDGISGLGLFAVLANLALLVPSIFVLIKRWHDRDKSGWWSLLLLLPIIGWIWIFVECGCLKGSDGPNRFGADPLAAG
ncbi:MAG TPA: DUF805 domain-containing protein [Solimonas sp.]|nr:DUF805 domain-containing protein [Solimonas sp.]